MAKKSCKRRTRCDGGGVRSAEVSLSPLASEGRHASKTRRVRTQNVSSKQQDSGTLEGKHTKDANEIIHRPQYGLVEKVSPKIGSEVNWPYEGGFAKITSTESHLTAHSILYIRVKGPSVPYPGLNSERVNYMFWNSLNYLYQETLEKQREEYNHMLYLPFYAQSVNSSSSHPPGNKDLLSSPIFQAPGVGCPQWIMSNFQRRMFTRLQG